MKQLLSIFILFLIITSCDPCDDCTSVTYEPTVQLKFINQDSISKLDALISINSIEDDKIDSLLQVIDDSETNKIDSLNNEKSAIDSVNAAYNVIKSTINSGLILVQRISIVGSSYDSIYTDSASSFSIPLSYDKSFNQYEIVINDFSEIIEFDYNNVQELDESRNVLIRATNIRVVESNYVKIDSVQSNCEETCIDGEAIFTFYF
ncbi:hypothetical protein [Ekhidna sp.]|uniref:hypothetical protein n=1 Tax=Ekhidna sp. TaxID=2608089 RepID=UPI003CCC123F